MATIRLKNTKRRVFNADLENQKESEHQTFRTTHDPKTGEEGTLFHSFNTYKSLTLQYNETSEPLDEDVLENASVGGAVRAKRLMVLR